MIHARAISAILCCLLIGMIPEVANAGFLVHATRKAFVPKIMKGGFKPNRMNPKARFGRQIYFADKAKTALKERPQAGALIRFRKSRMFNKSILDTRDMSTTKLKRISHINMTGTVKKGVIGPKLGHKIGSYASRNGKIIKYYSAKNKNGINYAMPAELYKQHPRIVRPVWK